MEEKEKAAEPAHVPWIDRPLGIRPGESEAPAAAPGAEKVAIKPLCSCDPVFGPTPTAKDCRKADHAIDVRCRLEEQLAAENRAPAEVVKSGMPSAADLDAVAEEQEAADRTSAPAPRPPGMRSTLEEGQRQLVLLALAELALSRPGFDWTLGEIAKLFFGSEMFASFKETSADRIRATHGPFGCAPNLAIQSYPDELDYVNATLNARDSADKSFLGTFCHACLRADALNYPLLRPVLAALIKKYPADPEQLRMERIDSGREIEGDR